MENDGERVGNSECGGSSRKAFEKYMREVFGVCSTFSEYRETTPRSIKDIQPGDVLVYPARPGHRPFIWNIQAIRQLIALFLGIPKHY